MENKNKIDYTTTAILIFIVVVLFVSNCFSQNFQTHYDFGKDRKYVTTTFEMFKPDEFGSTFMFIDFDFNHQTEKSISLMYMEISRYFKISGFDLFEPTIQYNDGIVGTNKLGPVWLLGIKRRINNPILNFNLDLLFRNDSFSNRKDAQITLSWFEVYNQNITFCGFIDIWSSGFDNKKVVFLSEPQIWYNVWNQLHIGSEIEISKNFIDDNKVIINPTLALKWNFK